MQGSSNSSQWQQGWQQPGAWWERRPAGRSCSAAETQAWNEQQAKAKTAAKAEARTAKRARHKQEQAATSIDPQNLKLDKIHLADMRIAQKLWTIFPHDLNTTDPVLKYSWGIDVPDDLQQNFKLEMVTDHRWGLYAQTQPMRPAPAPIKKAVRQASPRKRMHRAELLAAQFRSTKQRFRSPSKSPLRRRSKGPAAYAQGGSRTAEAQNRANSGERPPTEGTSTPSTKRWWYPLTQAHGEEQTVHKKPGRQIGSCDQSYYSHRRCIWSNRT